MRSSTKSWLLLGAVALSSTALAACSADGGSNNSDSDSGSADDSGTTGDGSSGHDGGAQQDSSFSQDSGFGQDTSVADTSTHDTSTADVELDTGSGEASSEAGVVDAGDGGFVVDAGDAGLAPVGSPCSPVNATQKQVCGLCGFSERVCLAADAGSQATWQPWGFCQGEVANGCAPGTQTTDACGLCGSRVKQCQNDCTYAVGACTGQPPNACSPGSVDFEVGLSCDAGGRQRVCQSTCIWDNFGACIVPDGGVVGNNFLAVPSTAGAKASKTFTMPASPKIKRLSTGTCPGSSISSTLTSYNYVQLQNNNAQAVTVSLFHTQSAGGAYIDSVMTVYSTVAPPPDANDTAREQCKTGSEVNDTCSDSTTDPAACQSSWAGLMIGDNHQISMPAHSYLWVYNAAYFAADSGNFDLNVIVDSIP